MYEDKRSWSIWEALLILRILKCLLPMLLRGLLRWPCLGIIPAQDLCHYHLTNTVQAPMGLVVHNIPQTTVALWPSVPQHPAT
jgi:hypothetical protein